MFNINYSKVVRYVILLIVGMSFISYGILTFSQPREQEVMTDAEIIERAKDLGLVEPRDLYIEEQSE